MYAISEVPGNGRWEARDSKKFKNFCTYHNNLNRFHDSFSVTFESAVPTTSILAPLGAEILLTHRQNLR